MSSGRQSEFGDRDDLRALRERLAQLEQQNAQLGASEERLQILFEQAPDGYYLSDLKGTFVDGNPAAERITGYKREELVHGSFLKLKLLPTRDLPRAASLLARNVLGQPTGPDEFTLTRKDGAAITVEISTRPVRIAKRRLVLGIARDITERKRVEHQLRERTKELQALYSLAGIAEREGISLEELYQELANILPKSWRYEDIACARIVVGGREFRTGNFAESRWKQSAPVKVSGAVIGTIDVSYLDERPDEDEGPFLKEERLLIDALAERLGRITERRRAEEALRESEERFRMLHESAPVGLYRTAPDGSILLTNAALAEMLGFSSSDELSARNLERAGFEQSHARSEFLERIEKEGTVIGLESVWTRQDGSPVFVSESARATRNSDGKTLFYDGTVEDITERKKSEDALRESEDRYRGLVDNVPGIIFTMDLAGKITFVSRRVKETLGYESADVINKSVLDFVPEEDRQRAMESIQKGMTGAGIKHFETPMIKGSGERVWLECSFARVRRDGVVIGAQGTATDITERKRAEEALRLSEQAARELAEQLQLVSRVGVAITSGLDLERLMQTIYEEFQLLIPTDTFYIALYDDATGIVTFPLHYKDGERRTIPARDLRETPGLLGQVIDRRQSIYLPDAPNSSIPLVNLPGPLNRSIIVVPLILGDRIVGVLSAQSHAPNAYSQELVQMLERLATQIAIAISNSRLYESVSHGLEATLTALGRTAERRDPYTAGHQRRVTDLALAIARKLEYGEDACSTLRTAAMLHDIGKLGVPAEILSKPTALSKIEFELIRTHPQAAYEILADIAFPGPVAEIVLQHHERQDGSGYPKKISGDDILPEARILAVADVVEAMASHRPYRPALGTDAALTEIRAGSGTRYDQQIVDACVALFESGEFSFQPASAD